MGVEIPEQYGGTGANFMSMVLTVEEVAKVDGSVAALVDIHNSLVNKLITKLATKEQKAKYLPQLAQDYVSKEYECPVDDKSRCVQINHATKHVMNKCRQALVYV